MAGDKTNDVLYNKAAIIEKCLARIREVYDENPENLLDFTKQDSIILNLQRASEAAIDMGMHLVSELKLGIPQHSRDAFLLLFESKIISEEMYNNMRGMVGFRNIAVHNYQALDTTILVKIINHHLKDLEKFSKEMLQRV